MTIILHSKFNNLGAKNFCQNGMQHKNGALLINNTEKSIVLASKSSYNKVFKLSKNTGLLLACGFTIAILSNLYIPTIFL